MTFNFNSRNVLITGASRGIGRAIALGFADAGANVALHYLSNEDAAQYSLSLLSPADHHLVSFDMADPDALHNGFKHIIQTMGRLDILINNAGIYELHHPMDFSYPKWIDVWDRTLKINLFGPAHLCFLAAEHMKEKGGGKIINISSRGAYRGEPSAPAYGAAKAGLNSLTQSLAQALAPHQICVYGVAPGFVETDMAADLLQGPEGDSIRKQSPLNRVATPDEVARIVLFLASEGIDYATGAIVDVNGASYLRS